mmetsp:Transcript_37216/g.6647  ORF Transcript_37216/g.6647 Transcript_37216/m.6647 type:complete len:84 (+) Transcript_37216:894-1145(+)
MDNLVSIKDIQTINHRLFGVCDISCDLNGGIEFCHKFTDPNHPFFLYDPKDDQCHDFLAENSHKTILYHSVDFLPSELPRDAS